ncbi:MULTISPECIES: hypothetical protein [Comamonas]|uniref:Uncharacterized protein n=1 Tax=Comamonas testosteroni TaxID=285 RepID=A0A8B4S205_COMTE|nr:MULTISPECIES: hypothetical protein [Comamonas]EHN65239.1 hypothetical protein CTATCC11996_12395 [Comamonas testosteroni ATCC 11996]QQN69948.1 hypothetical protein IYN88_00520 [Comamonas testosteroni]RDI14154.1 hypothetical protein DFO48_102667 [Comamonas sp. AG1104]SUY76096.1 Uncharacterised protein [Comamonas testosteroni]
MGREYKIKCVVPDNYDPTALLRRLPNPSNPEVLGEVYNYAIEPDGFYFIDHLADRTVAAVALQSLLDEALRFNDAVELIQL